MTVAVLGLGAIGLRHARNLRALGRAVVGFDPDSARVEMLEAAGGRGANRRATALAAADAAVIASPNRRHLDDLAAAVEAGCHAFVEKPLAHTDRDVEAVLAKAAAAGRTVFAGLNQRFNPAIREARSLLDAGRLGDPIWARFLCASYLPDWRPGQDHRTGYAADTATGGVLFDVIHEFDLADHLLGPAETVAATARRSGLLGIASEDCADVVLRHASGIHSTLHLDYLTRPPLRAIDIAGTGGVLQIDVRRRHLTLLDRTGAAAVDRSWPTGPDEDYLAEMTAFLDCVDHGAAPACDGRTALRVLRQVLSARRMCGLPDGETAPSAEAAG